MKNNENELQFIANLESLIREKSIEIAKKRHAKLSEKGKALRAKMLLFEKRQSETINQFQIE